MKPRSGEHGVLRLQVFSSTIQTLHEILGNVSVVLSGCTAAWRPGPATDPLANSIGMKFTMVMEIHYPVGVPWERKQEAELSHRDRAAGWVSFGAATGGSLYAQNLHLRGRPPPSIC